MPCASAIYGSQCACVPYVIHAGRAHTCTMSLRAPRMCVFQYVLPRATWYMNVHVLHVPRHCLSCKHEYHVYMYHVPHIHTYIHVYGTSTCRALEYVCYMYPGSFSFTVVLISSLSVSTFFTVLKKVKKS